MRNFDPNQMFVEMALRHQPQFRFNGRTKADFDAWRAKARPAVLACLGDIPQAVPPNPELIVEWTERGLRMQRWVIDVHPSLAATVLVNIPGDLKPGEKRPAILCWHGHGRFGKDPVMGDRRAPELVNDIQRMNYDYGFQMAKAGFVTYALDWIGVGEHDPARKPNNSNVRLGQDWCHLLYLHATMFGTTSIAINVQLGRMATDFVCTLPEIDGARLGVMGLSGGGTATTWSYLCDERFRAAEIICYCDQWAAFGMRDVNYCGMQVAPGLYKLVDLPDLQGLLAPKPLLMDIGLRDQCFLIDTALPAYRQVEHIYQAASAADKLELDLHPNDHGWGGNKSMAFFQKHLHCFVQS